MNEWKPVMYEWNPVKCYNQIKNFSNVEIINHYAAFDPGNATLNLMDGWDTYKVFFTQNPTAFVTLRFSKNYISK